MISFFGLSLSCLNAGSRIMFVMGEHSVFPRQVGRIHPRNGTPSTAITTYIVIMFLIPTILEIVTNPVTTFGDAGTLAAWGFLAAYFWISVASPVYLKKRGELRPGHIVIAVLACLCLLFPTIGSFYPVPPFPVNIFPYLFLAYMAVGGTWLYLRGRHHRGLFTEIEADLEATVAVHEQRVPAAPPLPWRRDPTRSPASPDPGSWHVQCGSATVPSRTCARTRYAYRKPGIMPRRSTSPQP